MAVDRSSTDQNGKNCNRSNENLVLLATSLAYSLAQGLADRELVTLINLLGITTATLNSIYTQRSIDSNNTEIVPLI